MKKQIILGGFLALTTIGISQNTFPTGAGTYAGIGTTSPIKALEIKTSVANDGIAIRQTNTSSGGHATLRLDNAGGHNYGFCSSGATSTEGPNNFILYDYTSSRYNFFVSGANGNVGFGTTAPNAALDIFNTSNQLRLSYSGSIFSDLQTTSAGNLYINPTGGRVGIGTNAPNAGLDLRTTATWPLSILGGAGASAYEYRVQQNGAGILGSWVLNNYNSYGFGIDNVTTSGKNGVGHIWNDVNQQYNLINFQSVYGTHAPQVWIGDVTPQSPHTDFMFAVAGKVVAQSLYITASGSPNWADYVFAEDYKVPNLYDVEKYYKANKHLPEVPTTKEIEENGINVGEMNTLLLKKIEELTIHMVEQQKQIDELKSKK